MTVYHGTGEFWTDEYASEDATGGALAWAAVARLSNTIGTGGVVGAVSWTTEGIGANVGSGYYGLLFGDPQALPSGVPGTDVQGSISWGTYIHLSLLNAAANA